MCLCAPVGVSMCSCSECVRVHVMCVSMNARCGCVLIFMYGPGYVHHVFSV